MRARSTLALTLLLGACSDYQLDAHKSDELGGTEDDVPVDTGTDSDTDTDTDAGTDDDAVVETAKAPTYVNTSDALYAWDPDGELELIAEFWSSEGPVQDITDIAIDTEGYIYGCSNATLYRIHAETGQALGIASLDARLAGLTFVSDGRLVGAGDGVYLIDPASGSFQTLVPEGEYVTSGDIVGLPDGLLYWTVWGEDDGEPDRLIVIDPDTGRTVDRGDAGVERIFGLGYADGVLYGFTDAATVVRIDPDFGGSTQERPLGAGGWWGATTNPVRW